MNPFDLPGPQFLVFYNALIVVATFVAYLLQKTILLERRASVRVSEVADPYAIAYLRGGVWEAWKVAVFSLMDRGLLVGQLSGAGFSEIVPAAGALSNALAADREGCPNAFHDQSVEDLS